jgi:Mlc titration factor MtfA (ptsG expression regulator)
LIYSIGSKLIFSVWENWRRRRVLRKHKIPADQWDSTIKQVRAASHLSIVDRERLRNVASLFLHDKYIEPAEGMELTDAMRMRIACEAAIPILNLDPEHYHAWHTVIVYPAQFVSHEEFHDGAGVVHRHRSVRAGEAWQRGPVVISWEDVIDDEDANNVIIHEAAHKLDMLDGVTNGRPPIHSSMSQKQWATVLSKAYASHVADVDAGRRTRIDAYAAKNPAEFFAVTSEAFFEIPDVLKRVWPDVYIQLSLYYRQQTVTADP